LKQLSLWLRDSKASQLDQIYAPILRQLLLGSGEDPLDSEDQLQLKVILGALILLANPLPAQALAGLLDIKQYRVNHWLRNLHAVVSVPGDGVGPVRLLHKSFSDFLLDEGNSTLDNFRVDEAESHSILASRCIRIMESDRGLKHDMCAINLPGKLITQIETALIDRHISLELKYACLFWVYHLQRSGQPISDEHKAHAFFRVHYLHWLEALSLTKHIPAGVMMLKELKDLLVVSDTLLSGNIIPGN
jgi:hypothetical protein